MLVGINVADSWLAETTSVMNGRTCSIPFVYLGLPTGGDARRLNFWNPLLNRIKTRLPSCKSRNLSFGGRLVLLKSVMSSLLV